VGKKKGFSAERFFIGHLKNLTAFDVKNIVFFLQETEKQINDERSSQKIQPKSAILWSGFVKRSEAIPSIVSAEIMRIASNARGEDDLPRIRSPVFANPRIGG